MDSNWKKEVMMEREKVTIPKLYEMKRKGEKIAFLTGYDYPTAALEDEAGIDMILIGDSGGMTTLGYSTTLPVTMNEMMVFTGSVCRAVKYALVVGDMPYMSYQASVVEAIKNAGRFIAAGCDAIKLEGGARVSETVRAIVKAGIPVMGHIGLTPQSYTQLGGFKVQGRTADTAKQLLADAKALEEAGVFAILIECVPAQVGKLITESISVPTLGLGAGADCDGQIVIVHDILSLFRAFRPKFVKVYANVGESMLNAFKSYVKEVKSGEFPKPEHFYKISREELAKIGVIVEE